ncbi:hypothetical protein PBY51_018644 [Eleginops maclovinus]|uniref:Uncharacterized protein n=1 Tax=Eleginops maclovinus TaxID=56733 RepID=A0AAN7YA62_ELEMC|nr:hypothetical protein PBY51_018644 [Eleginops maclovinus]
MTRSQKCFIAIWHSFPTKRREEVQGEETKRTQSASDNKQAVFLPAATHLFEKFFESGLGSSRSLCWVTKREGKWEETVSCIAGSGPIVIKEAGVSSETPGCRQRKQSVRVNSVSGRDTLTHREDVKRRICSKTDEVELFSESRDS